MYVFPIVFGAFLAVLGALIRFSGMIYLLAGYDEALPHPLTSLLQAKAGDLGEEVPLRPIAIQGYP